VAGLFTALPVFLSLTLKLIREYVHAAAWPTNLGEAGKNVKIKPGVTIRYPRNIRMGSDISIDDGTVFKSEFEDGFVQMGSLCTIGKCVLLDFSGGLSIGDNVMISEGAVVQTHDHGYLPKSIPKKKPLVIEDNVWIAMRATILAGVNRIGENSIIAAGAVVTREVPKNSIVAGNPAKVIKEIPDD
jgi:acetyltransferase-like isoleucine patch superfamily enzyme